MGALFCHGCTVSNSVYYYVLTLTGCTSQITYTGYVHVFGSPAGMIQAPTAPLQDVLSAVSEDTLVLNVSDEALPLVVVSDVEDTMQQPILHLRPNPATDQVWLEYAPGMAQVWLLDAMGHRVLELAPQGAPTTILQVAGLAPAFYSLMVLDTKGKLHNRKLIKQ